MATTRSLRVLVASTAAGAAILVTALVWLNPGSGTAAQPQPFWPLLYGERTEINPPADVDALSSRSDAVVVGHVIDVTDGRELKGFYDPTPGDPTVPSPRTAFVQVAVDRVVSGPVAQNQVVEIEMLAPPQPLTVDTMRSRIPPGQLLFFLRDNVELAKTSGHDSPLVELREKGIWQINGSRGLVAAGSSGLYEPLDQEDPDLPFLQSFGATTLGGAADRAAKSAR